MDRNLVVALLAVGRAWSLSARRAWIEITVVGVLATLVTSLSARRAWIEIPRPSITGYFFNVALRKESVDRNQRAKPAEQTETRRSPQGERG